jgi:hypothetical protein
MARIHQKTGENVYWIWATLLIPIGGGLWALIKRRAWPSRPAEDRPKLTDRQSFDDTAS